MNIYRRVRDLREDNDKTQKEIADVLNMQLTVYRRYESGERELPLWAAMCFAKKEKSRFPFTAEMPYFTKTAI